MKLATLCTTLALGLLACEARAATLGLATEPAAITGSGSAFNEFFGVWTFQMDGLGAAVTEPGTGLAISILGDITDIVNASLTIQDGALTTVLSGSLLAAGFEANDGGDDSVELLFGSLTGTAAAGLGDTVLLRLTGELGSDPVGLGFGSFFAPEAVDFALAAVTPTAAIPTPASLPLLGAALMAAIGAGHLRRGRA